MAEKKKIFRVGLGVSGGIAAYKAIEIMRGLQKAGCEVSVAMTRHACEFIQPLTFRALSPAPVIVDDYDPGNPDPIAHINFSQNIDLFLVAPATANIIAKFANGIADDFISSTYLASTAPVLVAPAMNTTMWEQSATKRNIATLIADGVRFVKPVSGQLACQTVGTGKLNDVESIVSQALALLDTTSRPVIRDLEGEKILISAGGTREEIDPVRFISNYSSGKMGFALAEAARRRGANVTVVAGTTSVSPPDNIRIIKAVSAEAMYRAVTKAARKSTVYIGAAAVSDYRPARRANAKIKKTEENLTIVLEKTKDILADVSQNRQNGLLVVGFAAETNDVITYARSKMKSKGLDMIVANDVSGNETGFGSENNKADILIKGVKEPVSLPEMPKQEMADKILDQIVKLRKKNGGKRKK